jgi:hypothetical protein
VSDGPNSSHLAPENKSWQIIHGESSAAKITLIDSIATNSNGPFIGSYTDQTVEASRALVGIHLDDLESPCFTGINLALENLLTWSSQSAYSASLALKESKLTGDGTINIRPVGETIATLEPGIEISLEHSHTLPNFTHTRRVTTAMSKEEAYFKIRSMEPKSLKDITLYTKALQDLITLASNRASGIIYQELRAPQSNKPISLYSKQVAKLDSEAKAQRPNEQLFTLKDISFPDFLPKWLELEKRLGASCNMLFGLRYITNGYVESRLLTAVTAAEALHRELDPAPEMPARRLRYARRKVLKAVPEDMRAWLESKLAHNEPSLQARLNRLASRLHEPLKSKLLPDAGRWASYASKARNSLAHRGIANPSPEQLYAITEVTAAVVMFVLLVESGVDAETINKSLRYNRDIHALTQLAQKHLA